MSVAETKPTTDAASDEAMLSLEDELFSAMAEIENMGNAPTSAPAPAAAETPTDESADGDKPADAAPKGLKFKIGKKGDAKAAAPGAKSTAKSATPPPTKSMALDQITGAMPHVSIFRRGVRLLDASLEVAAAPMTFLPPRLRKLFGAVALVTITVSAASAMLLPIVLPYRDAMTFLADRRAALDAAAHGEHAAADDTGHGEAKDAHGEKKPDKKADAHGAKPDAHGKPDAHAKPDAHGKPEKKSEKKDAHAKPDAHGGGHGDKPAKKDEKKKPDKKDDGHGKKDDGHGAKDAAHGGNEKKKPEKKPAKKDAKKGDKKKDDGHGGH